MPKAKFPPMAGGSGDCHDGHDGRDGRNVICIEAKRVCDFCFQTHRVDRTFTGITAPTGTMPATMCEIDEQNVVCREVERREVDGKTNRVLVCLAIEVPVRITIGTEVITQRVVFLKQAVLCAPEGTTIECQVTGNCCCFFDAPTQTLNCVFDFCVVIQSQVIVRVLVPIMGVCAPVECRTTVGGCPPMVREAECERCRDLKEPFEKGCNDC